MKPQHLCFQRGKHYYKDSIDLKKMKKPWGILKHIIYQRGCIIRKMQRLGSKKKSQTLEWNPNTFVSKEVSIIRKMQLTWRKKSKSLEEYSNTLATKEGASIEICKVLEAEKSQTLEWIPNTFATKEASIIRQMQLTWRKNQKALRNTQTHYLPKRQHQ